MTHVGTDVSPAPLDVAAHGHEEFFAGGAAVGRAGNDRPRCRRDVRRSSRQHNGRLGGRGPSRTRQWPGSPEVPTLTQTCAQNVGSVDVRCGFDPFCQHDSTASFGVGTDRIGNRSHLGIGAALNQSHVQLDHVGRHERQQRERAALCADIIDRNTETRRPGTDERLDERSWVVGEGTLGHLDHDRQFGHRGVDECVQALRTRRPDPGRFHVHEQLRPPTEASLQGASECCSQALPVEFDGQADGGSSFEQSQRRLELGASRASGERFVRNDVTRIQIDDRLIHRPDQALVDDVSNRVHFCHCRHPSPSADGRSRLTRRTNLHPSGRRSRSLDADVDAIGPSASPRRVELERPPAGRVRLA